MKLDHIGIATESLAKARALYKDFLGLELLEEEVVEKDRVRVASYNLGECRLELLEPLSPDSPVGKFLEKRGEGIHHICFEVKDIDETLKTLKGQGVPLIDESPRQGAHGRRIAFLHPRGTGGVLIELVQKS